MLNIFISSFLVALTGALSPGPLLTFTIYKSVKLKRGYIAGIFIVLGHSVLEFVLVLILLIAVTFFSALMNIFVTSILPIFLLIVGIIGGILLVLFGILTVRKALTMKVDKEFTLVNDENLLGYRGNSFIGGILVSLSNPYWIFWWAVVGLGMMINFGIGFHNPWGIFLFYIGHILGDIVWYLPISTFVHFGGKALNPKVYKYILIACGAFMVGFGIYLAINIILFPPSL